MKLTIRHLVFAATGLVFFSPLTPLVGQQLGLSAHVRIVTLLVNPEGAPVDQPPLPVIGFDSLARTIRYPELYRRIGLEGRVIAGAFIDTNGIPSKVSARYVDAELFYDAVSEAMRQARFTPAKWEGHAVACEVILPFQFSLHQGQDSLAHRRPDIVEVVFNRSSDFVPNYLYRVSMTREGTAMLLQHQPVGIDTLDNGTVVIDGNLTDIADTTHGFFNPLELNHLSVLLDQFHLPDSTKSPWRFPWGIPKETVSFIFADGSRGSVISYHENPFTWTIVAAVEHIVSGIRWTKNPQLLKAKW